MEHPNPKEPWVALVTGIRIDHKCLLFIVVYLFSNLFCLAFLSDGDEVEVQRQWLYQEALRPTWVAGCIGAPPPGGRRPPYRSAAASSFYEEVFLSQFSDWLPTTSVIDVVVVSHLNLIRMAINLLPAPGVFLLRRQLNEDEPGLRYFTEVAQGLAAHHSPCCCISLEFPPLR